MGVLLVVVLMLVVTVVTVIVPVSVVVMAMASTVVLMELLGAIGALEFMALARNGKQGNGHQKNGERFHRAASIATHRGKATPKAVEFHG